MTNLATVLKNLTTSTRKGNTTWRAGGRTPSGALTATITSGSVGINQTATGFSVKITSGQQSAVFPVSVGGPNYGQTLKLWNTILSSQSISTASANVIKSVII